MPMKIEMGPAQSDGSPFVAPCMFPAGVYMQLVGCSDDGATDFTISSDTAGDTTKEFSYNDWVLMAGGGIVIQGAQVGDWATLEVYCPATPVEANGSNAGNCNVVGGTIVPANGDGAYDVDLDDANPVLTPLKDGYWEWSFPNLGKGAVTAGVPGQAGAHLIAADYTLAKFARKLPLIGSLHYDLTIPAIEPKIVLPHWKTKVTLHNGGHTGLTAGWYLTIARIKTT